MLHEDRKVSIHAPAWGATGALMSMLHASLSFDPRPRMGSDQMRAAFFTDKRGFDPRPRTGSDRHLFNTLKARPKAPDQREPPVTEHRQLQAFRGKNEISHDFKELFSREPSGK